MHKPRSVRDADVAGKRVLVRVDFNVPLEEGKVADDTRIRAALPTLQLLLEKGASNVICCSHLGRPKGVADPKFSLKPVAARLAELLGRDVAFDDPSAPICVIENTRYVAGETKNDPEYAKQLAALADVYVNDAFGSAHRAHSSTEGVAHLLPAYAGLLLEKELDELGKLLGEVERPFVVIVGGLKVEDKIGVLRKLGERADELLIGGKMAEQVHAENPVGRDVELPDDTVIGDRFAADADTRDRRLLRRSRRLGAVRHRPAHTRALLLDHRSSQDDLLERPDGRVRVSEVRGGHEGGRRGGRGVRRAFGGWRRGRCPRDRRGRRRRQNLLGLDRRRRFARAARG